MKAIITEEMSLNREILNHKLDIVMCDIKQIKTHINNADKRAFTNYDFTTSNEYVKNLIATSNMLKVEIKKM